MKSILVPLYWLWCGVSVFVLVRRRANRKDAAPPVAAAEPAAPHATAALGMEVAATQPVQPLSLDSPTALPQPPPEPQARPSPSTNLAPPSPEARALSLGVPLSSVDSLAEALQGISLPCGLTPLMGSGEFDPKELVLSVDDHPAATVATAVADEIESLGFTLTPLDERRLMATNDVATVEISVHPDVAVVDEHGARRFPTAPPDGVVVELRLR